MAASTINVAALADTLPFISLSGVLTPAQIQQQVNAIFATSDARTLSNTRRLIGDMAGRGFSANSPILAALQVGLQGQGLRAAIDGASQAQLEAAKVNADAILNAQKMSSDQFLAQEGMINTSTQIQVQRVVGVLQAVCGMVGGLG